MYSVGIDSVEISRVSKSIENERFINKVYGEREKAELEAKIFSVQSAAACFAAKEAFGKALGTGLIGFDLNEVQVIHNERGKPLIILTGRAKELADKYNFDFDISITHTETVATAVVIAFRRD